MKYTFAILSTMLIACGGASASIPDDLEMAPVSTETPPSTEPTPALPVEVRDASPDAKAADAGTTDADAALSEDTGPPCTYPGTQVLCYGMDPTDAGISFTPGPGIRCDSVKGCSLRTDPLHANPDVCCCPGIQCVR